MSDLGVHWTDWASPVGPLRLAGGDGGLCRIVFLGREALPAPAPGWTVPRAGLTAGLEDAIHQLEEYFAGTRRRFDLPLAPQGTPFEQSVWSALRAIPHGVTVSYGELARRLGRPGGARAVGGANGRNPLPIVIPCHRVIASDGTLGGYGGGLDIKRALLRLEGVAWAEAPRRGGGGRGAASPDGAPAWRAP